MAIDKPPTSSPLQKHQPASTPGELPPISRQDHPTEKGTIKGTTSISVGDSI
jgi:hypothetical protein